jgi:uncharacterized phage infection (PIP) family protein YhgE
MTFHSIKKLFKKLNCTHVEIENIQVSDQYILQEYNRLRNIEFERFKQQKLEEEQQKLEEEQQKLEEEQQKLEEEQQKLEEEQQKLEEEQQKLEEEQQKLEEEQQKLDEEQQKLDEEQQKLEEEEEIIKKLESKRLENERLEVEREIYEIYIEQEREKRLEVEKEQRRKRKCIHNVFLHYKVQYKDFYSIHNSPINSHFNEKLFNNLCNIMKFEDEAQLLKELDKYNNTRREDKDAYRKLSNKKRLKCDMFNFYLFI